MLFRKKPQNEENTEPIYGFAIPSQPVTKCSSKGLVCLLRGLLIFSAAYGCIGGVISSFELPHNPVALFLILLSFSVIMAFLHYSRLMFNLFYPVIFISFTYFIFSFRYLVNSGYQAFLNILQKAYGDYYLLDIYREGSEYFKNRGLTITFAAVFIGFFLILLLNIFVSEYMSLVAVILLTFPVFQIGIYVEKMPSVIYLILLLFSYFMVGILRCSRHFLLPYRDKKWTEFRHIEKNASVTYSYHASGKIFLQLMGVFFAFAILTGIIALPLVSSTTNSRLSAGRRNVDDYIKAFTQNGLSAFFNRYQAKGGISGGQLGGVSSVRPDYETDLNVTFVPTSYNSLYLKAYTGTHYTGYSWEKPDYPLSSLKETLGADFEEYNRYHALLEGNRISEMRQARQKIPYTRMEIENLDAEPGYFYQPYYLAPDFDLEAIFDRGAIYPSSAAPSDYSLYYYPYTKPVDGENGSADLLFSSLPAGDRRQDYIQYSSMYDKLATTEVPERLSETLESFHAAIGTGKDLSEQVTLIRDFFEENYPYTQTPGTTPMDADFVQYFLETQKRGYCAHFASAGVMLLRSYGYPARYVEGYMISLSEINEGSVLEDEDQNEWLEGTNPLGRTGVVSVPVTDGSAHAWAEVYVDGFGWVPVEFTPPSDETEEGPDVAGFWEMFTTFLGISGRVPDNANSESRTPELLSRGRNSLNGLLKNSVFRPVIYFIGLLLAAALLFLLIRNILLTLRLRFAYRRGEYAPLVSNRYKKTCRTLARRSPLPRSGDFLLPADLPGYLEQFRLPKDESGGDRFRIADMAELLRKCLYSEKGCDKREADLLLAFFRFCKKGKYKRDP